MAPALLTAVQSAGHVHLIIGSNPLAGARCSKSVEVGAKPKLIAPTEANLHYGLQKRVADGEVEWLKREFRDEDLTTLGREEVDNVVDTVFVTLGGHHPLTSHISNLCCRLRIPINVADTPSLCSFTLLSTHTSGPLQIGVTTSGKGCHLASRIRREITSTLPPTLGAAVDRVGAMRRRIQEEDAGYSTEIGELEDDDAGQTSKFNNLVRPEDVEAAKTRRMRWLTQMCEYWPLKRLAAITDEDVEAVLAAYSPSSVSSAASGAADTATPNLPPSLSNLSIPPLPSKQRARIILAGSGPGHPSLLTLATVHAIRSADIVLADKLVPAPILDLIPRRTHVTIARKFPGNADAAQDELLHSGLAGLKEGKTVLRLKQGDPFLYGRGAEEVQWFRDRGFEAVVLPGLTSALTGPLFAGVPVTHRAISDGVIVCTGTGRKGMAPRPPSWEESRTVVWLMALHRVEALVASLIDGPDAVAGEASEESKNEAGKIGKTGGAFVKWPPTTPCAVIERASSADQRVIRTTLQHVVNAVQECGSRPPGLLVVGRACEVLHKLEKGRMWEVEEGLGVFDTWISDSAGAGMLGLEARWTESGVATEA